MTGGRFVQVEGLCRMIINLIKEWRNDGREVCAGRGVVSDDNKFDEGVEK